MARIEFAPEVLDDFDRILSHLTEFEVDDPAKRISEVIEAFQVLTHSPLIGRPVKGGKRELVIGRDVRGYLALYRFIADVDTVFVLAIRSQRERRYRAAP